jgi:hypothetical protein
MFLERTTPNLLVIRADSLEEQVFLEEESQSLKVVGVIRVFFLPFGQLSGSKWKIMPSLYLAR